MSNPTRSRLVTQRTSVFCHVRNSGQVTGRPRIRSTCTGRHMLPVLAHARRHVRSPMQDQTCVDIPDHDQAFFFASIWHSSLICWKINTKSSCVDSSNPNMRLIQIFWLRQGHDDLLINSAVLDCEYGNSLRCYQTTDHFLHVRGFTLQPIKSGKVASTKGQGPEVLSMFFRQQEALNE